VLDDQTMSSECLLGRYFIKGIYIYFGDDGGIMINSNEERCNGNDILVDLGLI